MITSSKTRIARLRTRRAKSSKARVAKPSKAHVAKVRVAKPSKARVAKVRVAKTSKARVARLRARRRANGLRPVVLWLPDTSDTAYRARIAKQCRALARLTLDEQAMAAAIEHEAVQIPGWR